MTLVLCLLAARRTSRTRRQGPRGDRGLYTILCWMSRRSLYRAISNEGAGEPGVFALVFIFPTPVLYELLIHLRGQYGEPAICVWGEDDQKSLSI